MATYKESLADNPAEQTQWNCSVWAKLKILDICL